MNRPKISLAEVKKLIQVPTLYDVYLVGIRGYYLNSMGLPGVNDRGIYDDCICLVAPNLFLTFNANTDPSRVRNATKDKPGMATLIPGVHLFKKGKHGLTKPGGGYPAFRPATDDESLPVTRDGQTGIHKGIAINIHKGGYTTTSSEGCQTIHPDQWLEMQVITYKQMEQFSQRYIPYILVEQK